MLRPINRAHLPLHPDADIPARDVLLPYPAVLQPLKAVEQVLAEGTVEVELEAGCDGGEKLGGAWELGVCGVLGGPG